ncbi:MAG: hypothetical protein R2762_26505 [Bryobacteraceae bacterium]
MPATKVGHHEFLATLAVADAAAIEQNIETAFCSMRSRFVPLAPAAVRIGEQGDWARRRFGCSLRAFAGDLDHHVAQTLRDRLDIEWLRLYVVEGGAGVSKLIRMGVRDERRSLAAR